MKLLAIDTSSEACSAALQAGDSIAERYSVEPRAHTRILLPMIRELLDESGCAVADLDAVVLGNGPGSFIGMRIAASVAQGLCFGAGVPLVPVSSLAAVAAEVIECEAADKIAVAQDARMNEVYFAVYRADQHRLPVVTGSESIVSSTRGDVLQGDGWVAAGSGWRQYPRLAAACAGAIAGFSGVTYPRARYLLRIGAAALRQGRSIDPALLQPAYLRTTVAQPAANAAS